MQTTVNNIDFSTLKRTHVLSPDQEQEFWDRLFTVDLNQPMNNPKELPLIAFELGMSVVHQTEQKKVCKLCRSD